MSAITWTGMAVCGGLGAVARYGVDSVITSRRQYVFPLGIAVVNLTGSFVLGVLIGLAVDSEVLFIAGTGFLGGYTTFSTWMIQTERLADDGRVGFAMLNWLGSMAAGLAAAGTGWALGAAF